MLIRFDSNNNTPSALKILARNVVPSIKLKSYRISLHEICKILPGHKPGKTKSTSVIYNYVNTART